jgi:hypothetical protein
MESGCQIFWSENIIPLRAENHTGAKRIMKDMQQVSHKMKSRREKWEQNS